MSTADLNTAPDLGAAPTPDPLLGNSSRSAPRRILNSFGLYLGITIVSLIFLAGWFLPERYPVSQINTATMLMPPSGSHWFGTDKVGQDIFTRSIAAARTDLTLALTGTLLASVIGVTGGLLVSRKNRFSEWIMRVLDAFQSLPLLIVTIALVVISNNSLAMVAVSIALVSGPFYIRLVRSQTLSLRESRFVEAAFACGASWSRVMWRHLLPNLRSLILAQTALTASIALLVVAGLSFLGVGAVPPTPSWGAMIRLGSQQLATGQWWVTFFPGLLLFLCIISFNLIADGLRDRAARKRSAAL